MSKKSNSYSLFSGTKEESKTDEVLNTICPKLSYQQRLYGFCICAGIGWFLSFASFISFFEGETTTFAIMFSFGNLVCISSTCFLSGPKDQAKKMVSPQRYVTTLIFFASLTFTLICALAIGIKILTLISALIQFCAYVWYSLSFIPYGQKMLTNTFKSCCEV